MRRRRRLAVTRRCSARCSALMRVNVGAILPRITVHVHGRSRTGDAEREDTEHDQGAELHDDPPARLFAWLVLLRVRDSLQTERTVVHADQLLTNAYGDPSGIDE